ncbi:unnamed protein product [Cladocopium goreaui]|uniref:Uncharacterized protein n=1 Tax=Cladocopium goreaui TaxID=2562237 RepID=A0A9P1G8T0_9DINO|nr:unnamed protein product [Cladocopium goreaui]
MEILTFRFHNWCRLHGINHGQPVITKGHLALADYAELRLKAYASRVMTAYLAVALKALMEKQTQIGQCSQDLRLVTAATVQLANWFLNFYKLLALLHLQLGNKRYPLKPKAHAPWLHGFCEDQVHVGVVCVVVLVYSFFWIPQHKFN